MIVNPFVWYSASALCLREVVRVVVAGRIMNISKSEPVLTAADMGWDINYSENSGYHSRTPAAVQAAQRECQWVDTEKYRKVPPVVPGANSNRWSKKDLQTVMQDMPANPFVNSGMSESPSAQNFTDPNIPPSFNYRRTGKGDANLELQCLKCVLIREGYLNRLYALSFRLQQGEADLLRTADGSGLLDSLVQVRAVSLELVEAIDQWRSTIEGEQTPTAFVWKGTNYLLKMTTDLDFLGMIKPLVHVLGIDPRKMRTNPFMSSLTLKELQEKEESEPQSDSPRSPEQSRVRNAEIILVRESSLDANDNMALAEEQTPVDAAQLQHTAEVLQWHKHAEQQLQALRQPLADAQMGRTSTNRLYVPKRGGPLLQPLAAPQPQTLRDLIRKKDSAQQQPALPQDVMSAVGLNNCQGYIPDFEEYEYLKKRANKDRKAKERASRKLQAEWEVTQRRQQRQYTMAQRAMLKEQESVSSAGTSRTGASDPGSQQDQAKPKRSKAERKAMRAAQRLRAVQLNLQLPLRDISVDYIKAMAEIEQPPQVVALVAATVLILLVPGETVPGDLSWSAVRNELANGRKFLRRLRTFDPSEVAQFKIRALQPFISNPSFNPEILQPVSVPAAALAGWVLAVVNSLPEYKSWLEEKAQE